MNKLTIIDAEELAKRNSRIFLVALAAELIWLIVGIGIGIKYGEQIMGIFK